MPVHARKNQYQGINAHFNSWLQDTFGGWRTFHNNHITNLVEFLNRQLPENYYAVSEQSLQIEPLFGTRFDITRPDIGVLQTDRPAATLPSHHPFVTPTFEVATDKVVKDEVDIFAVVIYEVDGDNAITRIELLSPTNKFPTYRDYFNMRAKTLGGGIRLVELDYLHETPTPFQGVLSDYTQKHEDAYPFYIVVTDPLAKPEYPTGTSRFYCFHVDDPIPLIPLPLKGVEALSFDFGMVYDYTYENDRRGWYKMDYSQPPVNFDRYTPLDQKRIEQRRLAVVAAYENGESLDNPPLPLEN